jgi:hypothetical protein
MADKSSSILIALKVNEDNQREKGLAFPECLFGKMKCM